MKEIPILNLVNNTDDSQYSPQMRFKLGSTPISKFTFGVDDNDSDRLKISNGEGFVSPCLVIDPLSGNMGLMTTNPYAPFEMYRDDRHPVLGITAAHDTDYDPQLQFRTDATPTTKCSMGVDSGDSDKFKINMGAGIGGTDQFVIDNNGFVGIGGQAIPLAPLHLMTNTNTVDSLWCSFMFENIGASLPTFQFRSANGKAAIQCHDGDLNFYTDNQGGGYAWIAGDKVMTIDKTHNVYIISKLGIQESVPETNLHIVTQTAAVDGLYSGILIENSSTRTPAIQFRDAADKTCIREYLGGFQFWCDGNDGGGVNFAAGDLKLILDASGHLQFNLDNLYLKLGASQDWGITHDSFDALFEIFTIGDFKFKKAGANVTLNLYCADDTYDPQLRFTTGSTPTVKWSIGVDNSDSDKLKINNSGGVASGVIVIDQSTGDVVFSGDISAATIQAGGAEKSKFYTYTYTLDAADIAAGACDITITAVTLSKIRNLLAIGHDIDAAIVYSYSDAASTGYLQAAITSTTNVHVWFGSSYVAGDTVSVTIIEAE